MAAVTAWLLLAVGPNRQHGGNSGYDDDLQSVYRWDSTVPNHGRPKPGDVAALWDKRRLLGTGVIEQIERGKATKLLYRCAGCGGVNIKARKTKTPLYRCFDCSDEFDVPVSKTVGVITFAAMYEGTWREATDFVPAAKLRATAVSPLAQNSIRELNWATFTAQCIDQRSVASLTVASSAIAEGHVLRLARARIGQAVFRAKLLERYGPVCAVSGECPTEVLEAAHLYSYAATGRHHDHGGFLLRRDVHRLFDSGLLAVDPETLRVDIDASLSGYSAYLELAGKNFAVEVTAQQRAWLRDHWQEHRVGHV